MRFKKLFKKAQISWVEVTFVALLIGGFIVAATINNALITYTVSFISGLLFGKLIHHKKEDSAFPYVLLTIGFIIGYLIGLKIGNHIIVLISFAAGNIICYKIHEQGLF